LELASEHGR